MSATLKSFALAVSRASQYGVTPSSVPALLVLGDHSDGIAMGELAKELGISSAGVTNRADTLATATKTKK